MKKKFLDKITFVKSGHLYLFSPYLGYPNTYGFRLQFVLYPGYEDRENKCPFHLLLYWVLPFGNMANDPWTYLLRLEKEMVKEVI